MSEFLWYLYPYWELTRYGNDCCTTIILMQTLH
jgi:hypothetical protein